MTDRTIPNEVSPSESKANLTTQQVENNKKTLKDADIESQQLQRPRFTEKLDRQEKGSRGCCYEK